jgi:cysteine-rich repeat protein
MKCEEVEGLFTNEQLDCEDLCGDGKVTLKECDDGNTLSLDGCSSDCMIEFGYECLTPN